MCSDGHGDNEITDSRREGNDVPEDDETADFSETNDDSEDYLRAGATSSRLENEENISDAGDETREILLENDVYEQNVNTESAPNDENEEEKGENEVNMSVINNIGKLITLNPTLKEIRRVASYDSVSVSTPKTENLPCDKGKHICPAKLFRKTLHNGEEVIRDLAVL